MSILDEMNARNKELEKQNNLMLPVDFSSDENFRKLYDIFSFYFFKNLLWLSDRHHISGYLFLNEEEFKLINYGKLNYWESLPQKIINNSYDKGRFDLRTDFFDSNMIYSLEINKYSSFPIVVCFFYDSNCVKSSLYYYGDDYNKNIIPKTFVYNNKIILQPITYLEKYQCKPVEINASCSTINAERLLNLFKDDILKNGFQNFDFKLLNVSDCIGEYIKVSDGFFKGSHFEFKPYKPSNQGSKLIYFELNW